MNFRFFQEKNTLHFHAGCLLCLFYYVNSIFFFSAAGLKLRLGTGDEALDVVLMAVDNQNCSEDSHNKLGGGDMEKQGCHNDTCTACDGRG